MRISLFLTCIGWFIICGLSCNTTKKVDRAGYVYSLNQPDEVLHLSSELREISGLSYDRISGHLLAITDEVGIIYRLDPHNGLIVDRVKFGGKGDYEGIERVDSTIYVVKSNGNLYGYDPGSKKTKPYKSKLKVANDVEGLAFSPANNAIVLACKGLPETTTKVDDYKAMYSFDVGKGEFVDDITGSVDISDLVEFGRSKYPGIVGGLLSARLKSFAPSGLAFHPLADRIYIVSSRGKLIVITDHNWNIKDLILLDEKIFTQPEGICFDHNGVLYVSSESKGRVAKLFVIRPK